MASGAIPSFDDFVKKETTTGEIPTFDDFVATPAPKPSVSKPASDPRAKLGQYAIDAVKGAAETLNPLPLVQQYFSKQGVADVLAHGPAGPIARGIVEGAVEQGKKSYQAAKEGRTSEAVGHGLAAALPGVGPMAAQAAETIGGSPGKRDKYGNEIEPAVPPQPARGVGQAAAIIGGPRATAAVGKGLTKAATATKARFTSIDPKQGMTQALKPRSTNLGFSGALDRALPELKQTEQVAGTPITNLQQLKSAVGLSKQRLWSQYERILGPQAQRGIDVSGVAQEMMAAIPEKSAVQNPAMVRRIAEKARAYSRPLTIQQMEDYLHTVNAELDAHYGKYPASRGVDVRGNPLIAAKVAEAKGLRQRLYDALDDASDGAAPRELKQRYGALSNVEREIQRRENVAARQQPDSLSEQVGKWSGIGDVAKGAARILSGDRGGLADVVSGATKRNAAKWIKEQQTTDALIRRAFENYKGSPAPLNMPAPFRPAGLLPSGDIITPPPADTSFVRSTPGMGQPLNPRRSLPQGSDIVTPPPADRSYVRGAPGMTAPPPAGRALPRAETIQVPPSPITRPTGEMIPSRTGVPGPDPSGVRALSGNFPPNLYDKPALEQFGKPFRALLPEQQRAIIRQFDLDDPAPLQ